MPRRRWSRFQSLPLSSKRRRFVRTRRRKRTKAAVEASRDEKSSAAGARTVLYDSCAPRVDFSGPRELFCSLISPVSETEFFNKHWEKEPLIISRGYKELPPHSPTLFSLDTLQHLLHEVHILYGRHVNVCRYENGTRKSYGSAGERLTASQFEKLWTQQRATVQFLQPQQFQDELWHVISLLESYFNCLVGSNVYITPHGSQGLAPHYDDVEVLVLQLEGRKHWKLYPPSHPLPRTSSCDLRPEAIGPPSHDFVLQPGDLLYFPRGTVHQASTPLTTSHSTHITISTYQQNTWGDLLSQGLNATLHRLMATNIDYRTGIPLQLMTQDMSEECELTARDKLRSMGDQLLDHMYSGHQSLMTRQRVSFITQRLPPFTADHGPLYPTPSAGCNVRLKWPDHMVIVTSRQVRDVMECDDAVTTASGGGGETGEGQDGEEEEEEEEEEVVVEGEEGEEEDGEEENEAARDGEIIVYHSLANDKKRHMMLSEGKSPQPHGVRLPAHHLPALSLLLSTSSPLPSSSLPLSSNDTRTLLFSMWVEGLLEVT